MEAADEIVRAHDIIKTTVAAEGYIATMIPRPRLARQSNGEHIHIFLQSNDDQRTEESFLAGLLRWKMLYSCSIVPLRGWSRSWGAM